MNNFQKSIVIIWKLFKLILPIYGQTGHYNGGAHGQYIVGAGWGSPHFGHYIRDLQAQSSLLKVI